MRTAALRTLSLGIASLAVTTSPSVPATAATSAKAVSASERTLSSGPEATCYSNVDDLDDFRTMSQNFWSVLDDFDSAAADDVVLTKGCTVKSVRVIGAYSAQDAVDSHTVTFYRDKAGKPGKAISTQTREGEDDDGSFDIKLKPVKLDKGTYWVSVVANLDADAGGQWYWTNSFTQQGAAALWQNPRGGWQYGCLTWTEIEQCLGSDPGADLSFSLVKK